MSIPYTNSIANPSPGHYDGRNDLGYGRSDNSGLGSTWSMGDALSAPKGEWDKEEDVLLVDFKKILTEIQSLFELIDIEFDIEEELTVDEVEIERILLSGIVEDILRLFDIDIYNLEDVEFDEVEVSYIDLISQLNIFLEMFEIKSSIDSDLDDEDFLEINNKLILDKLEYALQLLGIELDSFDKKDIDYNKKIHTSLNKQASDSLSKRKTDPYSFNGLANTSQYLGASYKRTGSLVEAYIREVLLNENSSSGGFYTSRIGKLYPKDNASVVGGTKGAGGGVHSTTRSNGNDIQEPVEVDGLDDFLLPGGKAKPSTDGGETAYKVDINMVDDSLEDESSGDFLHRTTEQEYLDQLNVINKNKKI
tara:strand:- start:106 stop:1197 length:1092 start_codon:yes stop_codon:yes gene_type:complete